MQTPERLIPSLFTCIQEGYDLKTFRQDIIAGLTVAIVALPLAMAMAALGVSTNFKSIKAVGIKPFLLAGTLFVILALVLMSTPLFL